MQLPNDEIGISDILQWIACPERFVFGLRRRTGKEAPESWSPANAYGTAIHLCIKLVNDGATEDEAVQEAVKAFPQWLEPVDVQQLYADLETYQGRDILGVRTYMSEEDCRVPLFQYQGRWIYLRFTIDRLYQRLDDSTKFILVDYKSSKWVKSEEEVDKDKQLSTYDLGVHELIPELTDLALNYDQLRAGMVSSKRSPDDRERHRHWLIKAITAILEDESLEPRFNDFCPWCPLKMDCPVVRDELTDWAVTRIAALAPREPKLKKDGSPSKVLGPPRLNPDRMGEYVDVLPAVKRARQALEAFEDTLTGALKEMPLMDLHELAYERVYRARRGFTPLALREVLEILGEDFFEIASVSQSSLERYLGKNDERALRVKALLEESGGYDVIVPKEKSQDPA